MSPCRWSSNNWKCDLYCYESNEGFVTHVAKSRIIGEVPELPSFFDATPKEFYAANNKVMEFLDKAKHEDIGLPCDGESFVDKDPESFLQRVLGLRAMGYNFPDFVIESTKEDINEN